MEKSFGAIVLAAGEGKRMQSKDVNKVTLRLAGKPMILHTKELLDSLDISPIVIVVGFAKESVRNLLGQEIIIAEQTERLGTADAVSKAIVKLPKQVSDVLILQGDDSAFYKKEIIEKLIRVHRHNNASFTFLTIEVENPSGLGRVLRDKSGRLAGIIEEKDATDDQRKINEINPACYVANVDFLKKYLPKVTRSSVTGEYYLTSLIDIGLKNQEIVETLNAGRLLWRGVNTPEELAQAEALYQKTK